ncbi:Variant SH3 domain-containing protein [Halalkalibacter okhensis]|uniref:Variant SH3 domain-containing protein n=2 Tax=Halalkalibacter okhensis TaxID=333138 RepID=A0A0B0IH50_9BACI|nr:Variant SH3 domain-containing protein [Halalkalibacter okhensis]
MNKNNLVYEVIKRHKSNYPNPITLSKGQPIIVGKTYKDNEEWKNWIYCFTLDFCSEGWVPEQLINKQGKQAVMLEDYVAKELNVEVGEKLLKLKEINGWAWVRKIVTLEEGWVPLENILEDK